MEYVYAAMLLHRAGKEITEENLTEVLKVAGVNVDSARVKALVASISEIDIDEVIKSVSIAPSVPTQAAPTPTEEKLRKEEKREEKKEEKEEAAIEGLGALFG
ncbi:MAG: 50S ribosomal protein P1 [Candidatus Bathyarchaeia archaeon]